MLDNPAYDRDSLPEAGVALERIGAALEGHAKWLMALQQGVTDATASIAGLRDALSANAAALRSQTEAMAGQRDWIKAVEGGVAALQAAHGEQLADLQRWMAATTQHVAGLSSNPVIPSAVLQALGPPPARIDTASHLARMLDVWTVSRWVAGAPVETDLRVAVIVPTRNRAPFLRQAVESVLAQRHTAWQLIIVDDASTDETAAYLAGLDDARITALRASGDGASAARNAGLAAVDAPVVVHLDDDNILDPNWLRAVAWAFTRWPHTQLLYGARIVEDPAAQDGAPSGMLPRLEFPAFDRARLEQTNTIDMNVVAHRAGLPQARFDPALRSSIEWDMLLRLTAEHTPLELPVVACLYRSHAPNRLSHRPNYLKENGIVRSRAHTSRPLRVLSYNALFPLLSETYIEEEMLALEANGADIAFAAWQASVSPYPVRQPVYASLEEGIAGHNPDLLVVNWASHAAGSLDRLSAAGRPFALRVHSFDFDADLLRQIREHPLCLGIWAFPHQAASVEGVHALSPLFTSHARMPAPAAERRAVASISAGLPKKDWPLLLDALDRLPEFERIIVMARSNGLEHVPEEVQAQAAALRHPPQVHVNLPREEVFRLLARTSVLLYTVTPDSRLGMPMSVIEGLCAGACIVAPDRPEMHAMCGAHLRPYTTADDIVRQVRSVAQAGPALDAERAAARASARARFCDPSAGTRFHRQLADALTVWREAQHRG